MQDILDYWRREVDFRRPSKRRGKAASNPSGSMLRAREPALVLRVRPPGIERKTGRNLKTKKNGRIIENGPRREMGKKTAQKWRQNGNMTPIPFFRHFWAIFCPSRPVGHFLFFGHFFVPLKVSARFHSIPGGLTRNLCRHNSTA